MTTAGHKVIPSLIGGRGDYWLDGVVALGIAIGGTF